MGGTGKRFSAAGYTLPKPLLPLAGKRLITLAIESTSQLTGKHEWIIRESLAMHPLLSGLLPAGCWHVLGYNTTGPLETVLSARACLDHDEEVLICDCDSFMDAKELADAVEIFRSSTAQGGVTVRRTQEPECSYAEVTNEWWVTATREKDVFSQWSTTGPYWFKRGREFLKAAQQALAHDHVSISPVYNYLKQVKAVPVSTFHHVGTPAAYEAYHQEEEKLWPSTATP